jgi:hypothetical protein
VIHHDAFRDRVQQRRLARACRRDDESALSISDWRDEVDRSPRDLVSALLAASAGSTPLIVCTSMTETRPRWSLPIRACTWSPFLIPNCRTV